METTNARLRLLRILGIIAIPFLMILLSCDNKMNPLPPTNQGKQKRSAASKKKDKGGSVWDSVYDQTQFHSDGLVPCPDGKAPEGAYEELAKQAGVAPYPNNMNPLNPNNAFWHPRRVGLRTNQRGGLGGAGVFSYQPSWERLEPPFATADGAPIVWGRRLPGYGQNPYGDLTVHRLLVSERLHQAAFALRNQRYNDAYGYFGQALSNVPERDEEVLLDLFSDVDGSLVSMVSGYDDIDAYGRNAHEGLYLRDPPWEFLWKDAGNMVANLENAVENHVFNALHGVTHALADATARMEYNSRYENVARNTQRLVDVGNAFRFGAWGWDQVGGNLMLGPKAYYDAYRFEWVTGPWCRAIPRG